MKLIFKSKQKMGYISIPRNITECSVHNTKTNGRISGAFGSTIFEGLLFKHLKSVGRAPGDMFNLSKLPSDITVDDPNLFLVTVTIDLGNC